MKKEELLLSEKSEKEAQSGWKTSYRRYVVALQRLEPHPSDPRFRNGPKPALYFCRFPRGSMDPHALTVLHRLMRGGYRAYLVGGCVRDLLLGRSPKDFDVATDARPGELRQLFRSNCRIIGRRFRLAHIVFGDKVIETATFRRDPGFFETDGDEVEASLRARSEDVDLLIRNDNAFGEPHEDALRRDFRMNGLFYDIEREEVIDYVEGMRDIEERVLRTIGIADLRFREDPVRILRAIRLSARLDVGIDAECWDAMVAHRHELLKAARARLFEEIMRWMRGGAARRSFWLAWQGGILHTLLPSLAIRFDEAERAPGRPWAPLLWRRLESLDAMVAEGNVPSDAVLLALLLAESIENPMEEGDPALTFESVVESISTRIAVPKRIKERMWQIWQVQKRLLKGDWEAVLSRDFGPDAIDLFAIEQRAKGVSLPSWLPEAREALFLQRWDATTPPDPMEQSKRARHLFSLARAN